MGRIACASAGVRLCPDEDEQPTRLDNLLGAGVPVGERDALEVFVPANAVQVFTRHNVTMAGGSTAFYLAFLNEQRKDPSKPVIPTLRMLNGGGAPKPPEVFREVRAEIDDRNGVRGGHARE